jgi:hypothetical protein
VILSASTAHIIKIIKFDYLQDAATHVGYAERNSMVMHSVHTPAVTHPVQHKISSPARMLSIDEFVHIPQITLVLPPEVILSDRLADSAVHDYNTSPLAHVPTSDLGHEEYNKHLESQTQDPASLCETIN